MKRLFFAFGILALAACREEVVQKPDPVPLTAEAVGYYCQMELLDHEGPKGQVHLDGLPAPLFFGQVKDAVAYLHMPEQSHTVRATYVQDMASATSWAAPGAWIAAEDAVYVIGSSQMGGMNAPEFVPFATADAARAFAAHHGGEVRRFAEIAPEDVLAPSTPSTAHGGHDADADISARLKALSTTNGSN
ncbi:nitrous oxide reductase accessory protein NosL [Oceanibium sediminis]|uniref:nitrous oxide reductase accessory protein NosL n=1 Tax=Oceanibium sediminis TaxID=2026339 RepID=UPI000DD35724|nr:nitrous oxide reductase accessory protein NosL [Oceanibium sediminis]